MTKSQINIKNFVKIKMFCENKNFIYAYDLNKSLVYVYKNIQKRT